MDKVEKKDQKVKYIDENVNKTIFYNLLIAIFMMLYFIVLNFGYINIELKTLIVDLKVFSIIYLAISIFLFEKSYKQDNGALAINGIEILVIAGHTLSIMHVINAYNIEFRYYIAISSYIIAIYYVLKCIIIYTKGKIEYLKSLSDISNIVKEEEPVKKEAVKRKKKTEDVESEKKEVKKEKNDKTTKNTAKKSTNKTTKKKSTTNKKPEEKDTKKATNKSNDKTMKNKSTKTTKKKTKDETK